MSCADCVLSLTAAFFVPKLDLSFIVQPSVPPENARRPEIHTQQGSQSAFRNASEMQDKSSKMPEKSVPRPEAVSRSEPASKLGSVPRPEAVSSSKSQQKKEVIFSSPGVLGTVSSPQVLCLSSSSPSLLTSFDRSLLLSLPHHLALPLILWTYPRTHLIVFF